MATSDQQQKGIDVKQHHRLAMGEKINGQTMKPTGNAAQPKGGLAHAKKK
jgi:hypothetical protein